MCIATLAIASAAISAGSAVAGGVASANAANYQGAVAANNATIARRNAAYSAGATSSQVTQEGLKNAQRDAAVKVGAAANGLDVNTGSPANVEESQRKLGALDTATVAQRGAEQVYGYETQASSFQAQSALDRSEAKSDLVGGFLKAAGSLAGNSAVDSAVSSAFGPAAGGAASASGTGGGGGLAGDTIAPSLISGAPTVPGAYGWMGGNAAEPPDDFVF